MVINDMKKSILTRYHVNHVPLPLKPIFLIYGYVLPFFMLIYLIVVHWTSDIDIVGKENLKGRSNHIFCFWHTYIFIYFAVFLRNTRHVWMQHPLWYMKISHVMLRYIGIRKIILGSTGHSGQEAAKELVRYLKEGYSTVLLPDGPSGPPFQFKKGALHISMQSNVPILPMRFESSPTFSFSNWDQRKFPVPFSKITVKYGEAVQINGSKFEKAYDSILQFLRD